jgi:hypothetical protein
MRCAGRRLMPVCAVTRLPWADISLYSSSGSWESGGLVEVGVPFARDLHPEFGYVGAAPRLFRRIGVVLAFVIFGAIAGMSSVSVFVVQPAPEPDPMQALALAPPEPLAGVRISPAQPAAGLSTQKTDKASVIKAAACPEAASGFVGSDCPRGRATGKAHPAPAVNERPAIAAVPIGHRDDPAVLAAEPAPAANERPAIAAVPISHRDDPAVLAAEPATAPTAALRQEPESAAAPEDAAPAAQPRTAATPVVEPRKTRGRQQAQQRGRREYSASPGLYGHSGGSQAYRSAGWGSVW